MVRKWTSGQREAIEATGRDLLISAGAGSGKTAVLTERIIRHLTDPEHPADLSRMLIVTFTHAAATELKERISAAITQEIARRPGDRRLARQLLSLDRAKISTIHSFCLDVLRENANEAGLPAGFRIADSVEIELLRVGIMNEIIDDYYSCGVETHPIKGFEEFADAFVGTKSDDALAEIFLGIENKLSSFTEHIEFIKKFADALRADSGDFGSGDCGREILGYVGGRLSVYRKMFASILSELLSDEKLTKAYYGAFSGDIDYIDRVVAACEREDYFSVSALVNAFEPARLGSVRGVTLSEDASYVKSVRDEYKAFVKKAAADFFSLTREQLVDNCKNTADALDKLYTLLSVFLERFGIEKHRRGIVDFGDLERLAYKMLVDENGDPTDAAKDIRDRFDEIYIDEYQDVNAVQDAIFAAVSNGKNRFMVGDIKQSIYAFRGAEPMIFANYRRAFGTLGDGKDTGAAIFLSNNFRCDEKVIDFSNIVSGCLFTGGRGDIPFTEDDLLIHSKVDTECGEPVHVVLIDGSDDEDAADVSSREAEYVAAEIERLLKGCKKNNGEPICPSDIAIIMRSERAHSEALGAAFTARGIPYHSETEGDFFENAEVLLALCILNIIDNPTRDIYLAGALRSPVFGFTLDELVNIRKITKDGSLYDALRLYCKDVDFPKGSAFLDTLTRWRDRAEGMPVDKLLWYVYTDTDLLSLVYDKDNSTRRANLMLLYEYARKFEASSFRGIYNFIRYINDVLDKKAQLKSAKVEGGENGAVKLMTMHNSKGLEFPVCFICGTGKKFNDQDLKKNIVIERSLGISLMLGDKTGFARYDSPIRQALIRRLSDSQLEEEMRILYVAMTRARERLYVTGLINDPDKVLDEAKVDAKWLSRYTVMKNAGFMHWILTALEHHKLTHDDEVPYVIEAVLPTEQESGEVVEVGDTVAEAVATDELRALVREHFDFKYPHEAASKLPAKLSVSRLVPNLLDEDTAELDTYAEPYDFSAKRPLFLDGEAIDKATGAERGTATHTFMQFCDFSRFMGVADVKKTVEDEAVRLVEQRFITKRMASLVNVRQLVRFFEGDTFAEICAAKNVIREHRFNVKLSAAQFTENAQLAAALDNESVLVQGVIDCFWENTDGTVTLIDYKTDYIPSETDFADAAKLLLERHRLQLLYYKAACERITAKRVSRVAIYSFALGRAVEVE